MDHNTIRRLAFIKYLYQTSISQSQLAPPLSCASILTMHDAVELFLQLASEHLNAGRKELKFMEYWDILSTKLGRELEQRESMRRLNNSRVNLKHSGILPSQLDIESFRGSVTSFLNDNSPLVFGVSIGEVSLVEFVNPESSRIKLKEAEDHLKKGDSLLALNKIALAFEEMIGDYNTRKGDDLYNTPFYFGPDLSSLSASRMGIGSGAFRDFVSAIRESLETMQVAIRILALGLDYRKYSRFRQLTPEVAAIPLRGYLVIGPRFGQDNKPSIDDARFCMDFVVESAIALAEFDYTLTQNPNDRTPED